MKILVVDDEKGFVDTLKDNLEFEKYDVDCAFGGKPALKFIKANKYDLILLDVMMPDMDGFEVLEEMRKKNNDTPVIFLTARSVEEDKVKGLGLGADDYITKPFALMELIARIKSVLKRSSFKNDFEKELEVTRNIQQHVLPGSFPEIVGLDIFSAYIPAKEVGGDFYDHIRINDNTHSFLIADVSGKSLPASMFMALSIGVIRMKAGNLISPSKVLTESNKYIYKNSKSGMFVTMFYCVIEPKKHSILFGSAGHNEQILFRTKKDEFDYLNVKGLPLGMSLEGAFKEAKLKYSKGDIFVLYTDGVTEAMNKAGRQFEMKRFTEVIRKHKNLSADEIGRCILKKVKTFTSGMPQFDDITLMVIKFI